MLKRWSWAIAVAVLLTLLIGGQWYVDGVNQSHPAPWPMAGGSAGLRHYTPAVLPGKPEILWTLPVPGVRYAAPVIDTDGTLYVDAGAEVIAVGKDGVRRWAWRSPLRILSLALSRHGEVYAVDAQTIHALDERGRLQWRAQLPGQPSSPIIVGQGGTIYYAGGSEVHALSDKGSHKWSREVGTLVAGPVESRNGLILVATPQELIALRPNGDLAWSRTLGEPTPGKPLSAGSEGAIYLRTQTSLVVLNEKGEITSEGPPPQYSANLAVGAGVLQGGLSRCDTRGQVIWTLAPHLQPSAPVSTLIDRKGQILVMETLGTIRTSDSTMVPEIEYRFLNPEGRQEWVLQGAVPMTEPAVDEQGNLCFIGRASAKREPALVCVGSGATAK